MSHFRSALMAVPAVVGLVGEGIAQQKCDPRNFISTTQLKQTTQMSIATFEALEQSSSQEKTKGVWRTAASNYFPTMAEMVPDQWSAPQRRGVADCWRNARSSTHKFEPHYRGLSGR